MHKYAVVVAGGKGERMGEEIPKQFLKLEGKPILMHTIQQFTTTFSDIEIILVLPNSHVDYWEVLCKEYSLSCDTCYIAEGGATRFHSVKNALKLVKKDSIVAIHDGVRPLVSSATIKACFTKAKKNGNAIPVVPVIESLRYIHKNTSQSVNRSDYQIVQTPQCFTSNLILEAYQQKFDDAFTDDASVVEQLGEKIHLVKGNYENIKITNKIDLHIAAQLMKSNAKYA